MSSNKGICYILLANDYPDALEKRLAAREDHLNRANAQKERGFILLGGATLSEETQKMDGSFILFEANSVQEVKEYALTDPYVVKKVWDPHSLTIKRFNLAALSPHLVAKC